MAVLGTGSDPGVTNILARYAYDRMQTCEEIIIYDGDSIEVMGYDFALTFSPETSIEECLQPPLTYLNGEFVQGVPLFLNKKGLRRCEFKYGLPEQYVDILKVLKIMGLDSEKEVDVDGKKIVPRKVVASLLPQPFELADSMKGSSCVGTFVRGTDESGEPLEMYLYTLQSHEFSSKDMGANITVFQAGIPAVVATEMILNGTLQEAGAFAPEQFDPNPWIEALPRWGMPLYARTTTNNKMASLDSLVPQAPTQMIG